MNELERYVDILFADYRQYEPARRLRVEMLNDLLLQKETLQMSGKNEHEAIREVLSTLDDFGAPAQGNILIYYSRLYRDSDYALLLWLIAGLVLSVPLLVLGNIWLSLLFLLGVVFAAIRFFRSSHDAEEITEVEFCDRDQFSRSNRKLWLVWTAFTLVWIIGVVVLSKAEILSASGSGLYALALKLARFYPPLVLAVVPIWASGRTRIMLRNEVGADEGGAERLEQTITVAETETETDTYARQLF